MNYKFIFVALIIALAIASQASALDRRTVKALHACHEYLWNDVPDFKELPNAAITVYPATMDDKMRKVHWTVDWDHIKASGSCDVLVEKGNVEVIGYEEDFKKQK